MSLRNVTMPPSYLFQPTIVREMKQSRNKNCLKITRLELILQLAPLPHLPLPWTVGCLMMPNQKMFLAPPLKLSLLVGGMLIIQKKYALEPPSLFWGTLKILRIPMPSRFAAFFIWNSIMFSMEFQGAHCCSWFRLFLGILHAVSR